MDDRSSRLRSRRQVLATMAVLGSTTSIAGCASPQEQAGVGDSGATDVIVHNLAAEAKTIAVTITAADADRPHTDTTLEVSPGAIVDPVNAGKLPTTTSEYTVEVDVKAGPSETFQWTDSTVQLAPLWVQVDGTRNVRFLLQAG